MHALMDELRSRAAQLLERPVRRRDLALRFDETTAAGAEVLVGGQAFYPAMLDDLRSAASTININQFGFRPGEIGDAFADVLLEKAAGGVAVRVIVDRQGSDPDRSSRAFFERLVRGGVHVRVVRPTQLRAPLAPATTGAAPSWNLGHLGHVDHRKLVVVDGRVGWVGGAGIEDHFHDGRFHDLFLRLTGPVVGQLQLVFVASFRWLEGALAASELDALFPETGEPPGTVPAVVLHNAPGRYRPITTAIAALLDGARESLDVVNPYVTDRGMIRRIIAAARRGVRVRLFVPAEANNWACASAQHFHHDELLAAGVRILDYPKMLHAKAFVRDGEHVLAGTCNLEAWSLRRFFEIDVLVRSTRLAEQFDERFSQPAEAVSTPGKALAGRRARLRARAFATISPLL